MESSLLSVGAFLGVTLLIFCVGRLLIGRGVNRAEDAIGSRRPLVLGPLTVPFAGIVPVLNYTRGKLRQDLLKAGYFHRQAVEEFLGFRNAAMAAWAIFIATALVIAADPPSDLTPTLLVGGGVVLALIYGLPRVLLGAQAAARVRRIQHALPDALDMVSMTMTGGIPLQSALERVARELKSTHADLGCELAILHHQSQTGSLEQGLRALAQRLDIPEVTALAVLVQQSERLGGNVAAAFRDYSDSIRRNRRQRAEERGNKASIKLMFPVVLCLAPPVYVMLLGPATLELRNFVNRENRPGGMLSPDISTARNNAVSAPRTGVGAGAVPPGASPTPGFGPASSTSVRPIDS